MKFWRTLARLLGALASAAFCASSASAAFPDKTVTIVVPFAAGSSADANVRVLAEKLRDVLNTTVVVENKPGANGMIGAGAVVRSAPDGYTVLYHSASLVINPWLVKDAPEPTQTLVPIAQVASTPYILAVRSELGIRSVADFVAYAKANPGRLSCSSYGVGSPPHLALELLKQSAGIQVVHVPYRTGFAQAFVDLTLGQLDCAMDLPANVMQHAASGKLVVVGATAPSRLVSVKDVPVISTDHPDAVVTGWSGFFAPAGTPPEVVRKLEEAVRSAIADPTVLKNLATVGMSPSTAVTRDEFTKTVGSDYRRFGAIIKATGIKIQ
ncbi:Bug family tripartite tricarboxylate transporter substrate binding protein [Hydrogenophaga sp.]|uniref:Bug family tripartite tricarboxylate transporter substrate binding protein n=1 Tax=Hydrogenophaga sp. TaxID=1904254 RepID=UPI003D0E73C0